MLFSYRKHYGLNSTILLLVFLAQIIVAHYK